MHIVKMEENVELSEPKSVITNYRINAFDIHPSVLKGLIPINTPAFIDENGETRVVQTLKNIIIKNINIYEAREQSLCICTVAIKEVLALGAKFLYYIKIEGVEAQGSELGRVKLLVRYA